MRRNADTAFPATRAAVRAAFADVPFDAASFARPLAPCDLARCRGTCCTAGVTLNAEEALVLRNVVRREGDALRALLPALPDAPLVPLDDADAEEDAPMRTALVPRRNHGVVPGYPAHFTDTACAFLMPDARCALQLLAAERGHDPWHWKPLACWLHPIALTPDGITLPDAATDPHPGGWASATPCGCTAPGGAPARDVLAPELARLADWLARPLAPTG